MPGAITLGDLSDHTGVVVEISDGLEFSSWPSSMSSSSSFCEYRDSSGEASPASSSPSPSSSLGWDPLRRMALADGLVAEYLRRSIVVCV